MRHTSQLDLTLNGLLTISSKLWIAHTRETKYSRFECRTVRKMQREIYSVKQCDRRAEGMSRCDNVRSTRRGLSLLDRCQHTGGRTATLIVELYSASEGVSKLVPGHLAVKGPFHGKANDEPRMSSLETIMGFESSWHPREERLV
jgi:hypothetical protein